MIVCSKSVSYFPMKKILSSPVQRLSVSCSGPDSTLPPPSQPSKHCWSPAILSALGDWRKVGLQTLLAFDVVCFILLCFFTARSCCEAQTGLDLWILPSVTKSAGLQAHSLQCHLLLTQFLPPWHISLVRFLYTSIERTFSASLITTRNGWCSRVHAPLVPAHRRQRQVELFLRFEANLFYRVNSRTAKTTEIL